MEKLMRLEDILRMQIKELQEENRLLVAKVDRLDDEIIGLLEAIDPLIGTG